MGHDAASLFLNQVFPVGQGFPEGVEVGWRVVAFEGVLALLQEGVNLLSGCVELGVKFTLNSVVGFLEVFLFDGEEELVSPVGVWCLWGWSDGEDWCWDSL